MDYKPVFSVIMPTHNRCYVIWKAVQSVLNQTYPFFELLIIDDASTDDTAKLMKEFTDPRIKYFKLSNKKPKGASYARNYGLKKAKGEFIAYLDSDNAWHNEFLEVMYKSFKKYPNKILLFCKKNYRLILIDEKNNEKSIRDELTNHRKFFDLKRLWHRRILIDTNTMCHKRKEIIKLGGWDEGIKFWEDWELALRISTKYPKGFLYINRTLLDYEQKINLKKADEIFAFWEKEEAKVFNKYKGNPLLEGQTWFPPQKYNKSTLGVIEYLKNKHKS
jgi:glycosyltransferase involved in cell wall biosynthesis